ncbi:MAG: type II toxin-antitoxin system prevent-host-death family antitoxin [Actinobacteria bacterium]|nr:type II toxin-antitoxin system prevent-host-death family antitoxin [Actinomycetota bacterium]
MADVAARDLRNRTHEILARVEGGEEVAITVHGRHVARLVTASERPQ